MATADLPLSGLRVLVTRPAHQSDSLINLLKAQGATPVALPLLEIQPVPESDPKFQLLKQKVLDLDLNQHVIFISVNAAEIALELIDQYWPQLPVGVQWLAIGKQTAGLLSNYGIDAYSSPVGYDSESLLSSPGLQQVAGDKVLIFRGEGGRETLAKELGARGAEVSYAELYRRRMPAYSDQQITEALYQPESPDVILISSGEGLQNLLTLATGSQSQFSPEGLFNCHMVVPSERIKKLAAEAGFRNVTTANGPDNQSMINSLIP